MTALIAILCAGPPGQRPATLAACLGKDFAAYESLLRAKPERYDNVLSEDRLYRAGHYGSVTLSKRKGSRWVNQITFTEPLRSRKDWRRMLSDYGLSPSGARLTKRRDGLYTIKPHPPLPPDWEILWQPHESTDRRKQLTIWQPIHLIK